MFNSQIWFFSVFNWSYKIHFLQEIELLVPAAGPEVILPLDLKQQRKSIQSCSIRVATKLLELIKLTREFSTSTVPDCKPSERRLSPIRYQFWLYFLFVYYDSASITLYINKAWNFIKKESAIYFIIKLLPIVWLNILFYSVILFLTNYYFISLAGTTKKKPCSQSWAWLSSSIFAITVSSGNSNIVFKLASKIQNRIVT